MDKERKGAAGDIYGNMEMTQARMFELLDRDSFVPTLPAVPDADTLTYTDTGGIVRNFRIGQQCRVADAESDQGYTFYQLYALEGGKAVWAGAGSGTGDVREKVTVTLTSNQAQPDDALKGAVIKVAGTDGASYFEGPWAGEPICVKVPPQIDYVVSVSAVEGYATPARQRFTSAVQGERQVELVYNTCVLTVRVASNQADATDVEGATAIVAYSDKSVTVKNGQSVKVPLGASVTVTASQVDKYQTPAVQRLTPQAASQTVTLTYSTCVLTVQVSGLQHSVPVTASVKYSSVTEQVQPGGSVKVPYGVSVTVSVSEVSGYAKPGDVVFTPNQPTHTASFEYVASAVRVTIDSNQPDKSVLDGLTVTLSYAGHTEQVASGRQVGIPTGTQITLSFPDVTGYRKPGNIVFTNSGGLVEKTGKYEAEKVTVKVSADNGASVAGQKVTVNGVVATWNGRDIVQLVPFGTRYSVSADAKSGFSTPAAQTFTAEQVSRAVSLTYKEIKLGVFIQHKNGNLYTREQWNTAWNAEANGVAVLTSNCKFVIAPDENYGGSTQIYSDPSTYPDLPEIADEAVALRDFAGPENTKKMTSVYGSDIMYAAGWCAYYTFKNGKKGHLPAMGELKAAFDNRSEINACLSLIGGTYLYAYYWSSTRYVNDIDSYCRFWYINWYDGSSYWSDITNNRLSLRVFLAF